MNSPMEEMAAQEIRKEDHSEGACNCPSCQKERENRALSPIDFLIKIKEDLDTNLCLSPFKVGDLVTPTIGSKYSRYSIVDVPYIVVRNYEEPKIVKDKSVGVPLIVNNMIVATFIKGQTVLYEVHSSAMRKWNKLDQKKFDKKF